MSRKRTDSEIGKCDGKPFGSRVRELRLAKKLSILIFAERVGICRNYVSQIESGDKLPSFETFLLIAKVLNVTPNDLLVDYIDIEKNIEIQYGFFFCSYFIHFYVVYSKEIVFLGGLCLDRS